MNLAHQLYQILLMLVEKLSLALQRHRAAQIVLHLLHRRLLATIRDLRCGGRLLTVDR